MAQPGLLMSPKPRRPRVFVIDIGGTHVKMLAPVGYPDGRVDELRPPDP